jgi:hypothetical protein
MRRKSSSRLCQVKAPKLSRHRKTQPGAAFWRLPRAQFLARHSPYKAVHYVTFCQMIKLAKACKRWGIG